MTRTICTRSSRTKPSNLNQECGKENVPLKPLRAKKDIGKSKSSTTSKKENVSPSNNSSLTGISSNRGSSPSSPIRKSSRKPKYVKTPQNLVKTIINKNVLCDKTNTPMFENDESFQITVLKTTENKNKLVQKLVSLPKSNIDSKNKTHVPVYKTDKNTFKAELENEKLGSDKHEAVYDFEVDENEEPTVNKKKRKKRVYNKKPKIGPKALTINNIKYSSSESLASLPEKPITQRKKTNKSAKNNLKPFSSMTDFNGTEDSSCSIKSFLSNPTLVASDENKITKKKFELSILMESQSELTTSQLSSGNQKESLPQPTSIPAIHRVSRALSPPLEEDVSLNPWCPNSLSTELASQASPCARNISTTSSHHFLSSTPCKKTSAVVCNNSVFDDSYDLPNCVSQSSGYINTLPANNTLDNCFGFDESEELEELLLSPIKNINKEARREIKKIPSQPVLNELKPSAQEVIELLKASIPKDVCKNGVSDMYDIELENRDTSLLLNTDEEIDGVNFRKPPRRSYERQRRVRHKSETEEESENEDCKDEKIEEVKEKVPKGGNKCYKRINTTRSVRQPKMTKAKHRIVKEEEEMERMAAMMNAQFQEIEKVSLVVE